MLFYKLSVSYLDLKNAIPVVPEKVEFAVFTVFVVYGAVFFVFSLIFVF